MTYSRLTDEVRPPTGLYQGSPKWSPRPTGARINGLNVHHWATTTMAGYDRLVTSSDPASANYLILTDGTLIGSVPEQYRAWTTSAYANDDDKVTVEVQNSTGSPDWRVSAAALDTLTRLYADLATRYGFPPDRDHIRGHRDYGIATACPGPYLHPRLPTIATNAAALTGEDMPTAREIADEVWAHPLAVPEDLQAAMGERAPAAKFLVRGANQATRAALAATDPADVVVALTEAGIARAVLAELRRELGD